MNRRAIPFTPDFRRVILSSIACLACALPALAKDIYVSESGLYDGKKAETSLQAAVAAARNGDTVWVENGFVCDEGAHKWCNRPVRIFVWQAITIRSRSGDFENQPVIRGAIDPAGQDGIFGKDSMRCIAIDNPKATLLGFRLEGGSDLDQYGKIGNGGGYCGNGRLKSCVIVGNYGKEGGGIANHNKFPVIEDCIVTNNHSLGFGGGAIRATLVGSKVIGNHSDLTGGGFYKCNVTNCLVACNTSANGGAGGVGFIDMPVVGCVISNNVAASGTGGGISYEPNLVDCVVIGNQVTDGTGGGAQGHLGQALRTAFIGNSALRANPKDEAKGIGGGANGIDLVLCKFSGNVADYRGGAIYGGTSRNCLISGNKCNTEGGGVFGGTHYNDLIVDNAANKGAGAGWKTDLVNCTVIGNHGTSDVNYCHLLNTVAYGDGKPATGSAETASHSCAPFLTDKLGEGNITVDPKLGTEGKRTLYVPLVGSPCLNAGVVQSWMTDAKDPSSRDLYGRRRVIGSSVDIGAFEAPLWGTMVLVR